MDAGMNTIESARAALYSIPPDLPREQWVRVGMGAHAAGLGLEDFDAWSQAGGTYREADCRATWRSFKPGGIGAGTLFHLAAEYGHHQAADRRSKGPARPATAPKASRPSVGAAEVWKRCLPATDAHPYIVAKRGLPDGLRVVPEGDPLRIAGQSVAGWLVVPVLPLGGSPDEPASLQLIPWPGAGKKLNLPGASMNGVFIVGELVAGGTAYLCEGIGQAWACWKATGAAAVVCFGWGRVRAVAAELRQRDASARLVLTPDAGKEGDADRIAAETGAFVARMPEGSPDNFDANDYAMAEGFDALEILLAGAAEPPKPEPKGPRITPGDEFLRAFRVPEPLIDGIVPRGQLYAMTAPTGHGKTAIATLMQLCIATGKPFAGREVEAGRVLVLAGENPDDYALRLLATAQALGMKPQDLAGIGVIAGAFAIGPAYDDLAAQIREPLAAVFVDTSAAFFDGDDENANPAMRQHASNLRRLCELPGRPAAIVLCHPTKHATKENLLPRGGGAFLAEIDGNLSAWREDRLVTLHWAGKLRGPGFEPLTFELQSEVLAVFDSKGRNVSSVAAVPANLERAEAIASAVVSDENALLRTMLSQPAASIAELASGAGFVYGMGRLPNKGHTHRLLQRLEHQGLVAKGRAGVWKLTQKGKTEAGEVPK